MLSLAPLDRAAPARHAAPILGSRIGHVHPGSRRTRGGGPGSDASTLRAVEQLAGNGHVAADSRAQFGDVDIFLGGVRRVNGSRTEEQRLTPLVQEGNVGRVWKDRRLESGH